MSFEFLLVDEPSPGVRRITLNRPDKRNAIHNGLRAELFRALESHDATPEVRVSIVRPGPSTTEQGTTWSEATVHEVIADWERWGVIRHPGALRGQDVARVIHAVVSTPRGTHLTLVEVEPEAPVGGPP